MRGEINASMKKKAGGIYIPVLACLRGVCGVLTPWASMAPGGVKTPERNACKCLHNSQTPRKLESLVNLVNTEPLVL